MDDSGAILGQLSALKDMLDLVNEEIEANFQITRDIESEIVKCSEIERNLAARESDLMKSMYMLQFEIKGLMAMNDESRTRRECLQKELSCMKMKQDEILERMNNKREAFSTLCLEFQKGVDEEGRGKVGKLLAEKEYLENEVHQLKRKINSLQNSMSDFVQEIFEGIDAYNSELVLLPVRFLVDERKGQIKSGNSENDKLVKDINELKATLLVCLQQFHHDSHTSIRAKGKHQRICRFNHVSFPRLSFLSLKPVCRMVVLEGGHTDHKSVSNTMQINQLGNAEPHINIHDQIALTNGMAGKMCSGKHEDMTLEDIYDKDGDYDEEDDSDWEPVEKHMPIATWFCVNCTLVNIDDAIYCHICGEHKESGILRHGFLASSLHEAESVMNKSLEQNGNSEASCSQSISPHKLTAVGFDERMLLHSEVERKSHPHPERPDRLRAIAASLATAGIFPGRCHPISAREITREELLAVHSVENIESVELSSQCVSSYFTPDTYANKDSALAARLAAGLCADLASAIYSGRAKNGFALVRPPGHHAGVKHAMGFCLHNNAAVAASAAQAAGAKKVLILDWDVHHGNGTQEIYEQNKTVLYISLHRHEGGKFYPGTGAAHEVGSMGGEGYCVNVPWSRGEVGDNDYIFAFEHIVLPIAREFAPDFTIISAGFDAARGDPLGCCDVTPVGYAQMTKMLTSLSRGKVLVILEGGYNLRSISSSATAVIKVLLGENPEIMLENVVPSKSGLRTVLDLNFGNHHPSLCHILDLTKLEEKPPLNCFLYLPCPLINQVPFSQIQSKVQLLIASGTSHSSIMLSGANYCKGERL
ncbi:hypothetical protein E3N88_20920 [Mikania micrantha]|uniref:histone deacetylase n=1 Tax=Mikania micrantha TaxID=192012 RepID=A0A5N6NKV8_9ASTR|nr:hypothetical protein E3N88_20920 [Mikania micrantha]